MRNRYDDTRALVSVLIPLYNHARYIEECLDSILMQGAENIELILIDDGSSDDGFSLATAWKEKHGHRFARIEFDRQSNAGITTTFDRLLRRSTGSAIAVVASDDVLLHDSIAKRMALLRQPGVMAVFGDAIPIDGESRVTGTSAIAELGRPSSRAALADVRTLPWELIFRWNVYGSVLLCRREAVINPDSDSVLNLDIFCEDMQLYYQLSTKGTLRYLNEPVAQYRVHGSNTCFVEENIPKLRKSGYEAQKFAMRTMPFWRRLVVGLQAFTYHRWDKSLRGRLIFPLVAAAHVVLLGSRCFYDFYRVRLLKQSRKM
ncbi:hypothetical protein ASF61_10935 [Duganella sp. Leaf126]|uniref:glycosyltransferase n=1 Tax=Duganella sp. Leaf126 TaxID=1736266 RepID=UPI0006F1D70A|nr:glycosyltransferase [Duganella sp. Leaf126]KQQ33580.1 hypothetical protein ASF61_10935 [Duganella sp. Leaf126]